jgi:chromatin segregation and condensation protein Rec8/ScpA/Scc1 (kleisin family)
MTGLNDQPIQTLLELVQQHKLDPWDIDIEKLVCLYIQRVREMVELDLRASGRALLSSSVLLRIKSDYTLNGRSNRLAAEEIDDFLDLNLPDLGEITVIQNTPRKITLLELIGALKEAISEMPERKPPVSRKMEKMVQTLDEYEVNILKHMAMLHRKILTLIGSGGSLSFFSLVEQKTRLAIARMFLLLLYLCSEGRIILKQPEMFGDITVSIPQGQVSWHGD